MAFDKVPINNRRTQIASYRRIVKNTGRKLSGFLL